VRRRGAHRRALIGSRRQRAPHTHTPSSCCPKQRPRRHHRRAPGYPETTTAPAPPARPRLSHRAGTSGLDEHWPPQARDWAPVPLSHPSVAVGKTPGGFPAFAAARPAARPRCWRTSRGSGSDRGDRPGECCAAAGHAARQAPSRAHPPAAIARLVRRPADRRCGRRRGSGGHGLLNTSHGISQDERSCL
jgi:hypothetical protein